MVTKTSRLAIVVVALLCLLPPSASAQFIVNDPQNGLVLIAQRINQLQQIQNQVQQLEYQLRNLRTYSQNWQQMRQEVNAIRSMIANSASKATVATQQLAQMDSELATLEQLQQMSNGAQGQLQATQTTNMLVAQLASQIQKQRAMTAVAALEEQKHYDEAYRQLYPPGMSALQSRL
jgi:conjugal transfer/entry exclusion protein